MGLHKIFKILMFAIGAIALVIAGMIWSLDSDALTEEVKVLGINGIEVPSSINIIFLIGVIVLVIVLLFVTFFALKGLFSGNAKNTLVGIGIFLLVIVISYALASSEAPEAIEELVVKNMRDSSSYANMSPEEIQDSVKSTIKWTGTGLNAFFILGIAAIGTMLFSGAKKLLN